MTNKDLRGKRVLVTGGAKGVGKAIAQRFAVRGAHVIINFFHSLEASKQTAAELRALGCEVDVIRASVAQPAQVDRMFDEIATRHKRLDILVNNAASGALLGVADITEAHFDRALDTNLKGAFWCARRAAALMAPEGGAIVNVSSIGARLVPANYLTVGTSKAALEALTRYLAVEFAKQNIRVNTASATLIEGDVAEQFPAPEATRASSIAATPLGRLATAGDLADLVLFLASDAARWVTGQVLLADGGLSLCAEALSPRKIAPPVQQPAALPETDDIAIIGMGLALPGANTPEEYWRVLTEGPELFGEVPPDRWESRSFFAADPAAEDKSYQARSVFMTGFAPVARLREEMTDGTAPRELTTLWLRHALMQAMEGVTLGTGDRTSFAVGYTADGSQHLEEAMVLAGARARLADLLAKSGASEVERTRCLAQAEAALTARYHRGAEGFAEFLPHRVGLAAMRGVLPDETGYMMVDTACSSSLYAVDLGIKGLLLGQHDVAVCGGAFALAPRGSVLFAKLHGLSKSGEVRPLDKSCDGVMFADGAGVVVLKRLARAVADGNRVLAVIKGFGASSDGKGKAIYAPSTQGQNIAIRRAYAATGVPMNQVDWVVAHATGTPAGDLAEFQSLSQMFTGSAKVQTTSNKSLIGHTGWAAGVASLIQVVLGLQKNCIPPQHRFTEAPDAFDIGNVSLCIPKTTVPWPAKSDARTAAVSGFGFGGTNGHLIVAEYRPDLPTTKPRPRNAAAALVIVGWSAKFPGLENAGQVADWLRGHGQAPLAGFGDTYPLPSFDRVRMPPAVLRALDRCQLMALDAAHDLRAQLAEFWQAHRDTIGVVMGHMGPTRNAALYASRSYLDDIDTALEQAGASPLLRQAAAGARAQTTRLVAATTENSFPGMMPNVIPARVSNYFDLHGLNMTIDAGHAAALAGFEVAARYLRSGELDMVLVGGINGNTAEEIRPASDLPAAEGLVLFAVMTQESAAASGLKPLATISTTIPKQAAAQPKWQDRDRRDVSYLGADGALAVLRAMLTTCKSTVAIANPGDRHRFALNIKSDIAALTPPQEGVAKALSRYRIIWEASDRQPGPAPIGFLPQGCVLVTDAPGLLDALAPLPPDLIVLSTHAHPGAHHLAAAGEADLARLIPDSAGHVRVLSALDARRLVPGQQAPAAPHRLALHDLAFLALKRCYSRLGEGGSFITLLLDAVAGEAVHPDAGLFSGLVKAMAVELPACRSLCVLTDNAVPREAVVQAERETGALQLLPVVVLSKGRRMIQRVCATPAVTPTAPRLAPDSSVVVAVGGARGITAETIKALARQVRPTLYILGSSDLDAVKPEDLAGSDDEFARRRPHYIREARAATPERKLAMINKAFDRLIEARTARRNLQDMAAICGAERVHYLRVDVLDADRVKQAIGSILQREQQVDLLVNGAGLSRTASIPVKSFADFIAARDVKVRGTWNLRAAFGARQPRAWCNFGSFIGLTGQSGETDYAAANDFLNTQAAYHHEALDYDEFTIGWTLWRSVGMGANPVTAAFLAKSGLFTGTSTEEGVQHFLREVLQTAPHPAVVYLGETEREAIIAHLPNFFENAPPAPISSPFYLGRELRRSADEIIVERVFDLETDAYLAHHVVNGVPTLPGTFVPEIAAEAALQLLPGAVVVGFEDVAFHHFLRVYGAARPSTKRISARLLRREGDHALVQVRVSGDVCAPGGQVLTRDKLHFEAKVLLAAAYAPAPSWPRWAEQPHTAISDPYHFDSAPVRLTGPFVSTVDTHALAWGKRARFAPCVAPDDPVFSRFVVPSILLDGLARVAALNLVAGEYIPLAAPLSIRRIDIYEAGNDCTLPQRHAPIELYATPGNFALEGPEPSNRFVAARPDGRMLLQMKNVAGTVIGYVHRGSGAYVSKAEVEALLAAAIPQRHTGHMPAEVVA